MKGFAAFTKKELIEAVRSYRVLIIGAVLLLFAISSPLLAKFQNQLISAIMSTDDLKKAGLDFLFSDTTYLDSYAQFFKNMSQMALPVLVFICAGLVSGERSKNTYIIPFSQGLDRGGFILAKFTAVSAVWTAGFALSSVISLVYTLILFTDVVIAEFMLACLMFWFFSELIIAMCLYFSTVLKNTLFATLVSFAVWWTIVGISFIPKISKYLPTYLCDCALGLITGNVVISNVVPSLICAIVLLCALIFGCISLFKRQEV